MNCQQHNIPFTLKPAGTTKAGKAYNAFWACSGKNPDGSFCKNKPPKDYKPTNTQTFNAGLNQTGKTLDYDKREDKRADGQSWGNAKSNSVNWAIALYQKGDMKSDQMKEWIEKCANWIHELEPKDTQSIPIKVAPPVTERELPIIEQIIEDFGSKTGSGDEIRIEDIPF